MAKVSSERCPRTMNRPKSLRRLQGEGHLVLAGTGEGRREQQDARQAVFPYPFVGCDEIGRKSKQIIFQTVGFVVIHSLS